jgi:hypothetical protein
LLLEISILGICFDCALKHDITVVQAFVQRELESSIADSRDYFKKYIKIKRGQWNLLYNKDNEEVRIALFSIVDFCCSTILKQILFRAKYTVIAKSIGKYGLI